MFLKLATAYVVLETICIIILLTLLIVPKETVESLTKVKISIESTE